MILIHTALLCEAQSFIEYYKLKKTNSTPKVYANNFIIICIGGVGEENTIKSLNYIFKNYIITNAFNIGIAGCNNTDVKIGTLFCTNHNLDKVPKLPLITSNQITYSSKIEETTLYDMEGSFFLEYCLTHLEDKNIYIFKIISDHLNPQKFNKDTIKSLISKQTIIHKYINLD